MTTRRSTRIAVASIAACAIVTTALIFLAVNRSEVRAEDRARAAVLGKSDGARFKPGDSRRAAVGVNESRSPDFTPDVEAYLLRAYPEAEIPGDATLAAQSGWAALNASAHSTGSWQVIGPSKATYPAVLNPFLFDGAQYVASGRVTAMAISPTCTQSNCTLYVAAAGGGVWRTDKALNGSNWEFLSGSFGTNAIGSLLMSPSDPSGNTLYAGTGEPNASND